jgi:precorrin-6Y C5,15-methyltransferase (decarboxylating) CbiT subunit
MSDLWPYKTPGIPDQLFARLPGIPLSKREVRLLLLSALRMEANSTLWDIGAGTGTIPVEVGLMCPEANIYAIERDGDVAELINKNAKLFGVKNIHILQDQAPQCLETIAHRPDRICIEGGKSLKAIIIASWEYLPSDGRLVVTASNLESLYAVSESFSELRVRNVEVQQSATNRLETRGISQTFAAVDPIFILSGEKI